VLSAAWEANDDDLEKHKFTARAQHAYIFRLTNIGSKISFPVSIIKWFNWVRPDQCNNFKNYTVVLKDTAPEKPLFFDDESK